MVRIRFKYCCICEDCGNTFQLRYDNIIQKYNLYCKSCRYKNLSLRYKKDELKVWNKGNHICLNTGKTHFKKGIHYNKETEFQPKEKHFMWKGGHSLFRNEDWIKTSRKIRNRDNHNCQFCKSKLKLDVHHIIPYRISNDDSEENLITLCKSCHKKMDIMYMDKCKQPMYYSIINKWRLYG